jgi:hypothetical protein
MRDFVKINSINYYEVNGSKLLFQLVRFNDQVIYIKSNFSFEGYYI